MSIVWKPLPQPTRLSDFMQQVTDITGQHFTNYAEFHHWSITHIALFWKMLSEYFSIHFITPPVRIVAHEEDMLQTTWFEGASLNFAEHLLRRNDEHPALICINEAGNREVLSYKTLRIQVASCAKALQKKGVVAGDRVAGILPNSAYSIIAFLATASLGAIWSSCSPDFGVDAIVDRLQQISPKILFITDEHKYSGVSYDMEEKTRKIIAALPSLQQVIICPSVNNTSNNSINALYWDDFLIPTEEICFIPVPFSSPLCILFSSGTTGVPKCIVHSVGGTLLQHIKELGLHTNMSATDTLFFYTTCGWMMWNWMVSGLALGLTLLLYEGAALFPTVARLFQIIEDEGVTVFGTSPKFLSTVEKSGFIPNEHYLMRALQTILSTGAPLLAKNYEFVYQCIKHTVQLSSISGGTDIISCFALGNPLLPVYKGELQCLGLGMAVEVFNSKGEAVENLQGELVCTKPFPSMPLGFWNDPDKKAYTKAYFSRFPNVWAQGDFAEYTSHHGVIIYGRSDAVLNPGGVRIGTAEIYKQVEKIPEILDSVVIGQEWQGDVRVVLFVKLKEGCRLNPQIEMNVRQTIKQYASARHVPAKILQVKDIPRTFNNKVVELAVKQTVQGQAILNLTSLVNPEALEDFKDREELR